MKKILLSIILILSALTLSLAQNEDGDALLKKANDSYVAKDYKLAIELYEQIVNQGFVAPELNYNLANAYYKDGNFTKAILNYERAIKLNPDFEDAKNNLKLANTHLQDQFTSIPESNFTAVFEHFVTGISTNTWAVLCIVLLTVGLGLFLLYFFAEIQKLRKFAFSFGFIFVIMFILALCGGIYTENVNSQSNEAIVTQQVVTAKSSPDESSTDLFRIHEGLKVTLKDKSSDWIEIRIADGRIGWVKAESLEKI